MEYKVLKNFNCNRSKSKSLGSYKLIILKSVRTYSILCANMDLNKKISRSMLTVNSKKFLSLAKQHQDQTKNTIMKLCEHLFEKQNVFQKHLLVRIFLDRAKGRMMCVTKSSNLFGTNRKSNELFKFFNESNLIGSPHAGKIFDQGFFNEFPLKLIEGFVFFLTDVTIPATGFIKLKILESLFPKVQLRKGECFNFFILAVKESNPKNLDLFDIIIIEEPKAIGNFQFLSELSMTYSFMIWESEILNKKVILKTITFCHTTKNIKNYEEISQTESRQETGQVNCDLILTFFKQVNHELNLYCDLKAGRVGEFNFNKRLIKEILICNNKEIETLPQNPDLSKFMRDFFARKTELLKSFKGELNKNENDFFIEIDQILTSTETIFEKNKRLQQIFIFYSDEVRLREICCNSIYFQKNINNVIENEFKDENNVEIKDEFYFDNKEMCNVTKKLYNVNTSKEKIKEFILNNTNKQWKGSLLENMVDL